MNEEEFDKFYENELKKNIDNINEPNIFDIIKKYKKSKGILLEEKKEENDKIIWDYKTPDENGIKCRVDEINQLNIIVQGSFGSDRMEDIIYECTKIFHQNNYKVVVIENFNGGGYGHLPIILSQLLQVKILQREYLAFKPINDLEENFNFYNSLYYNVETCKSYPSFDDFLNGTTVDYSTENEKILHKKTKITDMISIEMRKRLGQIREEYSRTGNLKKPTDIIIFTDSLSYSATSIFIKALQNEGGAITVGYNGNPFISKELFDASQAPSPVMDFSSTKEYKNLKSLGILVGGITYGETFEEEDYKKINSIPREYKIDLVDERSDIYDSYSDDKYDIFIEEAKKVFDKYNENKECNPNNKKLVFESDDCKEFEDDPYAHGGYPCGSDGKWNTSICKKFYCDIGYYFSNIENKCIMDYCTNNPYLKEIILTESYNETIIINKNNNYEYIFQTYTGEYIYFFEANEPGYIHYEANIPCPSLCVLQIGSMPHKNRILLNYFRNINDKDIIIKITSVKISDCVIESFIGSDFYYQGVDLFPQKYILITESFVDYIFYFKILDDSTKMLFTKYTKEMTINDIVNLNKTFFKEHHEQLNEIKSGNIYIFSFESKNSVFLLERLMQSKLYSKDFIIYYELYSLSIYLSKEIDEYSFDFQYNYIDRIIKLSKTTIDSEITIRSLKTGKTVTINSNNSYYSFDGINPFTDKITLKVTKGSNAVINFLYAPVNFEILVEKEFKNHKLKKPAVINFIKNNKNKKYIISLSSHNGIKFGYSFLTVYSKNNYIPCRGSLPSIFEGNNSYEIIVNNKKEILEEDESFYLIIYINQNILNDNIILISKEEDKNSEEEEEEKEKEGEEKDEKNSSKEDENSPLEIWAIAIIGILLLLLIVIIYILCMFMKSKRKVDSDEIGPLIEPNVDINPKE